MPVVREVLARVEVENLDSALETYCSLAGTTDVHRFRFGDIELAWVGRSCCWRARRRTSNGSAGRRPCW